MNYNLRLKFGQNLEKTLGQPWTDFIQTLGRSCGNFVPTSGRPHDFGQSSGKVLASSGKLGQTLGKVLASLGKVWAKFRLTSGKVWASSG